MPQATNVQDVFAAMPGRFLPEQASGVNATVQFDVTGDGGGQWAVTIADGKCSVVEGAAANPTMTMSVAAADYLAIINGELNAMNAFMQGKVKIKGDMALAMKVQKMFGT
jgi:putative sterol carrier protein